MSAWQKPDTLPHPKEAGLFWGAIRLSTNGGPLKWEVHLLCLDDETHDVHVSYDRGWRWEDYDFWKPCPVPAAPDQPQAREEAPAEAGEPSLVDWFQQFIDRYVDETNGPDAEALIACLDRVRDSYRQQALRAQPQAREEAQPVAWREWKAGIRPPVDGEWFVARCPTATRIVHYADKYDRLPIDHTGWVWPSLPTHWMPLSDYTTPPAPEAEKLREAAEALEPFAALADKFGCWSVVEVCAPDPGNPSPVIQPLPLSAFEKAASALTALQQEGE